jgi:hypothetical protein
VQWSTGVIVQWSTGCIVQWRSGGERRILKKGAVLLWGTSSRKNQI